ncbi:hypothetical protein KIPB_007020 [Kipferlia bialata]|uniref:Uncharacterized protein n=1 Tax=Kipferlia bialata TaxID=797122 RepID=A0A9K3CZE3_9EUKA|nr:hypothetical protein KIPB_007020 [Kipferlia bialata]|eukprot:g7020.t1
MGPPSHRTWVSGTPPLTQIPVVGMGQESDRERDRVLSAVRLSDSEMLLIRTGYSQRVTISDTTSMVPPEVYSAHVTKTVRHCPVTVGQQMDRPHGQDTHLVAPEEWTIPVGHRLGDRVFVAPQQPITRQSDGFYCFSASPSTGLHAGYLPCDQCMHWYDLESDTWHIRERKGEECWPGLSPAEKEVYPELRAWVVSSTGEELVVLARVSRRVERDNTGHVAYATYAWEYDPAADEWRCSGPIPDPEPQAVHVGTGPRLTSFATPNHLHVFSTGIEARAAVTIPTGMTDNSCVTTCVHSLSQGFRLPKVVAVGGVLIRWGECWESNRYSLCSFEGETLSPWLDAGAADQGLTGDVSNFVCSSMTPLTQSLILCCDASKAAPPFFLRVSPETLSVGLRYHLQAPDDSTIRSCLVQLANQPHPMHLLAAVVAAGCLCPDSRLEAVRVMVLGLGSECPSLSTLGSQLDIAWGVGVALRDVYHRGSVLPLPWSWQRVLSTACRSSPTFIDTVCLLADNSLHELVGYAVATPATRTAVSSVLWGLHELLLFVPSDRPLQLLLDLVTQWLSNYLGDSSSPRDTLQKCTLFTDVIGSIVQALGLFVSFPVPTSSAGPDILMNVLRTVSSAGCHWYYRASQALPRDSSALLVRQVGSLCQQLTGVCSESSAVLSHDISIENEADVVLALCKAAGQTPLMEDICLHLMPTLTRAISLPVSTVGNSMRMLSVLQRTHIGVAGLRVTAKVPYLSMLSRVAHSVGSRISASLNVIWGRDPVLSRRMSVEEREEWASIATAALSVRPREILTLRHPPEVVFGAVEEAITINDGGLERDANYVPPASLETGFSRIDEVGDMEVKRRPVLHITHAGTTPCEEAEELDCRPERCVLLKIGHNTAMAISYRAEKTYDLYGDPEECPQTSETLVYIIELVGDGSLSWRRLQCPFTLCDSVDFSGVVYGGQVWVILGNRPIRPWDESSVASDCTLWVLDIATETWSSTTAVTSGCSLSLSTLVLTGGRILAGGQTGGCERTHVLWSYNLDTGVQTVLPRRPIGGGCQVYEFRQRPANIPDLEIDQHEGLERALDTAADNMYPLVSSLSSVGSTLAWQRGEREEQVDRFQIGWFRMIDGVSCRKVREWDPVSQELRLFGESPMGGVEFTSRDVRRVDPCVVLSYGEERDTSCLKMVLLLWTGGTTLDLQLVTIYPARPLASLSHMNV